MLHAIVQGYRELSTTTKIVVVGGTVACIGVVAWKILKRDEKEREGTASNKSPEKLALTTVATPSSQKRNLVPFQSYNPTCQVSLGPEIDHHMVRFNTILQMSASLVKLTFTREKTTKQITINDIFSFNKIRCTIK